MDWLAERFGSASPVWGSWRVLCYHWLDAALVGPKAPVELD